MDPNQTRAAEQPDVAATLSQRSVVALLVLLCFAVHGASESLGAAFVSLVATTPTVRVFLPLLVWTLVAIIAAGAVARYRQPGVGRWMALVGGAYFAVFYPLSLLQAYSSDDLPTLPASSVWVESYPRRPRVTYRTSSHGFRQPDFDLSKSPGTVRVALIGDSFVFGSGVEQDGTLQAHLQAELARRWPAARIEVLNLGIPGNNIASHVDLYAAALDRFEADVTVLCLTLPNDLSAWDEATSRRDAGRIGAFSLVRFVLGDEAATWAWGASQLQGGITAAGLRHLDEQLRRLESIRAARGEPNTLVVFGFSPWDAAIAPRLRQLGDISLVPDGVPSAEEIIPGDGHPTSIGNQRSAVRIADTLARDERWLALIGESSAPPPFPKGAAAKRRGIWRY